MPYHIANHHTNASGEGSWALLSVVKEDFFASIVVFLVALPLCMGIAIASGVPIAAGLITGIVGGLVVGWFAGAPLQVSGPAAGLTIIVYDLVHEHGLAVLGFAVLIGGALQCAAGVLRFGRWFRAVSPAVIHGMLAGIGILIASSQLHVMVDDSPRESGIANIIALPEAIWKSLRISELGTPQQRQARLELTRELGDLHAQQLQLRQEALEITTSPSASAEARSSQSKNTARRQLEPIAAKQKLLADQLTALVTRLDAQGANATAGASSAARAAVAGSLNRMQIALRDLRHARSGRIRASQAGLQHGLERSLDQLKSHDWAAKVGLLTILVLAIWHVGVPSRLRVIPGPLVAIVIATIVAVVLRLPVLFVEVPDSIWTGIHLPSLAAIQSLPLRVVFTAGVVLAAVASAETLLCATAVDQMRNGTKTRYNQELIAQGIGNMACGLLGGLPMTGVIVRSAANVEAGAKTRLSTILHGTWLLIFVSTLAFLLRTIPTAALAAMLVYTGFKLVNINAIRELRRFGWGEVLIYVATLGTIVCADLLTGVLVGIGLSAGKLLYTFSHLEVGLDVDQARQTAILTLRGAATFVRLPLLVSELERVPENVTLRVDSEHLNYIDHACLELLRNWARRHEGQGNTASIDWGLLHTTYAKKPLENPPTQHPVAA